MSGAVLAIMASQAAAARRSLLERFRVSDATHPERAKSLGALGITSTTTFEEFVRLGAVRETTPGSFYLDESRVAALANAQPRTAVRGLAVVFAILGILTLVGLVLLSARQ